MSRYSPAPSASLVRLPYLLNVACFTAVSVSLLAALVMGLASMLGVFLGSKSGARPRYPQRYPHLSAVSSGSLWNNSEQRAGLCGRPFRLQASNGGALRGVLCSGEVR